MIEQPVQAVPDVKHRLVKMRFEALHEEVYKSNTVEMDVRGAIAWPMAGIPGIVIVGGRSIEDDRLFIFTDYEFYYVDSMFWAAKRRDVGLVMFISQTAWPKYGCNTFYYYETPDIYAKHRADLKSEDNRRLLAPIFPAFIETVLSDEKVADDMIRERVAMGTIKWSAQSDFNKHITRDDSRGRHALRCLLSGYQQFRFKDRRKDAELIEYWVR